MGGGLESRCVGGVYGADGAVVRRTPKCYVIHTVPVLLEVYCSEIG